MHRKIDDLIAESGRDDANAHRDSRPTARTTVFCAVWHRDSNRWDQLRAHVANLDLQSVPIERVYIFDGNDVPPEWLNGRAISSREPLTIYQAWNVALSQVATPFVLNLNLDDRLAPDAIELLEQALEKDSAMIAGGDWKICYSAADTETTENAFNALTLPFDSTWPPIQGMRTRLGSGTGERGTLGPATLWRMAAHIGAPRYPWRFSDGTLIQSAGDTAWWLVVARHLKGKAVRLPLIIGNYYSHPEDQAEFRQLPHNELSLLESLGVSLL